MNKLFTNFANRKWTLYAGKNIYGRDKKIAVLNNALPEKEANARLIIAAPEMYDQLNNIIYYFDNGIDLNNTSICNSIKELIDRING